ncbi:EF-hand domain-containing protein [Rheinheimera sp.]|uniref:EF-hand domain-containing protein n=1 Tax=Rheinheimera sp. TaxID=1869214 RepID=UPI00307D5A4F
MAIQFSSVSGGGYATMRSMPTAEQLQQKSQQLFSQLDQSNKGYLEQSDFDSLLSGLNDSAASDSSADLFAALDSDSDGKLTSAEFSDQASQLMYNAQGKMPPPPSGGPQGQQDSGKTADELSAMLEQADSDDPMAAMLQNLVDNFDEADSNSDGKVTMDEARAYQETQDTSSAQMTPPPPPPGGMQGQEDTGKTADELSAMLEETDSSDPMASMLQSLIDNFDAADADGDGKVTMQEAKAYQESQQSDSTASTSSTTETQSTESDSMGQLLQRTLQQLMKTYGSVAQQSGNESALQLTA